MNKETKPDTVNLPDVRSLNIELPDLSPPTPEEIERRRKIFQETMEARKKVKPPTPGNTLSDYIRLIREEDDPS